MRRGRTGPMARSPLPSAAATLRQCSASALGKHRLICGSKKLANLYRTKVKTCGKRKWGICWSRSWRRCTPSRQVIASSRIPICISMRSIRGRWPMWITVWRIGTPRMPADWNVNPPPITTLMSGRMIRCPCTMNTSVGSTWVCGICPSGT